MSSRIHPKNKHHCYNLDDCRALLEQLGYHQSEHHSYENDEEAVSISRETIQTALGGIQPFGVVRLNKTTGELIVTDRSK
jgi:hypothetical protein